MAINSRIALLFLTFFIPLGLDVGIVLNLAYIISLFVLFKYFQLLSSLTIGKPFWILLSYIFINILVSFGKVGLSDLIVEIGQVLLLALCAVIVNNIICRKGDKVAIFEIILKLSRFIVIVIVLYHLSQGILMSYKYFGETKTIFGLYPLLLLIVRGKITGELVLSIALLLLSGERKALLGVIIAVIYFVFSSVKFSRGLMRILIILGAITIVTFVSDFKLDIGKTPAREDFDSVSNYDRILIYSYSADQLSLNGLKGIGVGNFKRDMEKWLNSGPGSSHTAHNEYLRVLIETGWLSLLVLFLYLGVLLKHTEDLKSRVLLIYGIVVIAFIGGGVITSFYLIFLPIVLSKPIKILRNA